MAETTSAAEECRKQALRWLLRRHSGNFGRREQAALERWLEESPANRMAFEALQASWRALPRPPAAALADARRYRISSTPGFWRPALAAGLLAAVAVGYREGWPLAVEGVHETAKGESRTIDLPDGSRLQLNTASEVAVHYGWMRRSVEIRRGEALMTVAPGRLRPFEVAAAGGTIRDIGTRFDVDLRPRGARVTVLEGAVDVVLAASGEQRRADAGQTLAYEPERIAGEPAAADVEALSAWREGKLVFHAMPLRETLAEFARYHDLNFRVDDAELARWPISGVFSSGELEAFLAGLEAVLPVEVRRGSKGEVLVARRKRG